MVKGQFTMLPTHGIIHIQLWNGSVYKRGYFRRMAKRDGWNGVRNRYLLLMATIAILPNMLYILLFLDRHLGSESRRAMDFERGFYGLSIWCWHAGWRAMANHILRTEGGVVLCRKPKQIRRHNTRGRMRMPELQLCHTDYLR